MTSEIVPLFSTPVVISDLPDAAALNPELAKVIAERHKSHPGTQHSNLGGWQSTWDMDRWGGAAVIKLLETPAAVGEVFNIGASEEVTILELAERVKAAAGSDSEIAFVPYSEAYAEGFEDMQRRVPDVSKLERVIGFKPTTPLATIIEDVVADQRVRMAARV